MFSYFGEKSSFNISRARSPFLKGTFLYHLCVAMANTGEEPAVMELLQNCHRGIPLGTVLPPIIEKLLDPACIVRLENRRHAWMEDRKWCRVEVHSQKQFSKLDVFANAHAR